MKKITTLLSLIAVLFFASSQVNAQEIPIGIVPTVPNGQVGVAYTPTTIIAQGLPPFVCVTESPLPIGMSIDANGFLMGTPTEQGMFFLNTNCTNNSTSGTGSFWLTIDPAPVEVVVSTGKVVADVGKITEMGVNSIIVDGRLVRISSTTKIIKIRKSYTMTVGELVAYVGMKNTDNSVSAQLIVIGR